jgi:hypothetical protein
MDLRNQSQKQFKLVTRIYKILLITNDMTQKQFKLVTRINEILLITKYARVVPLSTYQLIYIGFNH